MMFQELEDCTTKLMINPLNNVFWTQEKLIHEHIEKYALEYELSLAQRSYQNQIYPIKTLNIFSCDDYLEKTKFHLENHR